MPELPEVETVVRGLKRKIIGKKIQKIWLDHPKMLVGFPAQKFKNKIIGEKIIKAIRRAKNILLELSGGKTLRIHLKMTGHLIFVPAQISNSLAKNLSKDRFNTYVHFIFYFSDGSRLLFSDLRKFGKITLLLGGIREILEHPLKFGFEKIGPEPLEKSFSLKKFKQLIEKNKQKIKIALMEQKLIAGIGNIYASEILFLAKVNPQKKGKDLSAKEIKNIYLSLKEILKKAIASGGTSTSDFRNISGGKGRYGKFLRVYGQAGKKCQSCGSIIKRIKQGQRSTFYCPKCQV